MLLETASTHILPSKILYLFHPCLSKVQRYHGYVEYGTIPDALVSVDLDDRDYMLEIAKGTASVAKTKVEPQDRSAEGGIVDSHKIMHLDKYLKRADLKKIKQRMKGARVVEMFLTTMYSLRSFKLIIHHYLSFPKSACSATLVGWTTLFYIFYPAYLCIP